MRARLSPIIRSLLEKAATDNGFDWQGEPEDGWVPFASTSCPLQVWLTGADGRFVAALSHQNVLDALGEHGTPAVGPRLNDAVGARAVADIPALHRLLRRAFQLSRTLPDELFHTFRKRVAGLPSTTEAERLVIQRVGQDLFRQGLLDFWQGRCAVTGLAVPDLLRASHIKPWADCANDAERLDVYNGLLLAPHLDTAFDRGFITVEDDGAIVVSRSLDATARGILGLDRPLRARGIAEEHREYLPWHRERVFESRRSE